MNFLFRLFVLFLFTKNFCAETAIPMDLIISLLPENPVVIEAGAQFGEDTEKMSLIWPNGMIYAFEPSPETYSSVEKLASIKPNVFSFPKALSNVDGRKPFYLSGGASSLLTPQDHFNRDYFHVDLAHPVFVECVRLDDWLKEHGIAKVDFLWFDMEGNELNALKGAENHLADVTLIYTEVNIQRFWNGCVSYEELKKWLGTKGFEEIWCEIIPHWQGNALFLNRQKSQ